MSNFVCPGCTRPLYNRRRTTCEFCGAAIPASLRLNEQQQTRIEAIRQGDRRRRAGSQNDTNFGSTGGTFFDFSSGGDSGGGGDCGGGGGDCG